MAVPEAEDSEEEDEASRGILRSLSSDHEEDEVKEDTGLDIDSGKVAASIK